MRSFFAREPCRCRGHADPSYAALIVAVCASAATSPKTRSGARFAHAAMMSPRAGPLSAAQAFQVGAKHRAADAGVLNPGRQCRSQECDYRLAQCGGNVSRTAIGRNHEPATVEAALGQPETDSLGRQGEDSRRTGTLDDLASGVALIGSAEHEHVVIELLDDLPGQRGAILDGPQLGGPVTTARIQRHDPSIGP